MWDCASRLSTSLTFKHQQNTSSAPSPTHTPAGEPDNWNFGVCGGGVKGLIQIQFFTSRLLFYKSSYLEKTELLVFPATPTLQHDFTIQLGLSTISPSASIRNLGVIFDDQLTFKEHIAKTARSCRFALHNIRKIRPFLTEHAAQLLVQALVILDWTTAMLFWLDFHQTQSNLYKWFRMQRHDWSSTSPKEPMLHLSLSPCTGYQLQLASSSRHWCLHIEQLQAQHPPTSTHYYEFTSPPEVQKSEIC